MLGDFMKNVLPVPLRRLLQRCLHYIQRLGRWVVILYQIRGVTGQDQWTLLRSALAAPRLSLRNLLQWQDPILLADAQVYVRGVGQFRVRARCDDLWHVLPWRERAIFTVIRDSLRPGDNFIDAGANIGIYSVLAAKLVGPAGKVIAVEMMPETADMLELNLALNQVSNVTVCRLAIGELKNQTVTAGFTPGKYGQASIAGYSPGMLTDYVDVKTTTLDEITRGMGRVRLIKIDLEGAEFSAMRGGKVALSKTEYVIYESLKLLQAENVTAGSYLARSGFRLRALDGNNWLASKTSEARQDLAGALW